MCCTVAPTTAAIDSIVPSPKEIRAAGEPVRVDGFRIVTASDERSRIGAEEINSRIEDLHGKALEVLELGPALPAGPVIIVAPCHCEAPALEGLADDVTPAEPGPQGYVIRSAGSSDDLRLLLIGSDELGALYAAVTCRQLIMRQGGEVVLQPAEARDWPDYKRRETGMAFSESLRSNWYAIIKAERDGNPEKARELAQDFIQVQKRFFDWMLRAKMNLAWHSTNIRPGDAPENTSVVRAALKEIHDYGRARGIGALAGDTTAIGSSPRDDDNPDFKDVVYHRSHKRYFCWSRLEYHQRRARRAADWLAEGGYTGYYLHATDGGGWQNPALWQDRCALCRETYGDDHARADAVVFGIYYREIKKRIPDLTFVAVVYPYTGRYLDPEYVYQQASATMGEGAAARKLAQDTAGSLTGFVRRLDTLLPPDVFVCIRESERRHLDLARQAWGDRRFQLYYEYAYWKGWRPYFTTTPLWTKSMYYASHDDIMFGPVGTWCELTQLLGAECAWNVSRPGAGAFESGTWRELGTKRPPPPERAEFARRACRFWFGEEAGPLMAPVFAENISHQFIAFPDDVLARTPIDDPIGTMAEQAQAATRAAASLDQLWDLQQRSQVLTGDRLGYFLNFRLMTHGARIVAAHRTRLMAARKAIRSGDRAGAERHLSEAREALEQAANQWKAVKQQVSPKQLLHSFFRKTAPYGYLSAVDIAELQAQIDDLYNRREALIAAHTIPSWFERECRSRTLVAGPAAGPVVVDGRLDEAAWQAAPIVEQFMDYRVLRLESLETQARLAYGRDALYVGFECFDPQPAAIQTVLPGRDKHIQCDSVEVLIARNGASKEFVHWIVDSQGTVFDARSARGPDGLPKYSIDWNGSAEIKAVRGEDRWTVEMTIPSADCGLSPAPGGTCRVLLCRNIVHTRPEGEEESNAVVFLDGSSFHTVEKFARLRFGGADELPREPQVALVLRPLTFGHETTGEGAGTRIGGDLRIETDRNLHDMRVTAQCTDGINPLGAHELGARPLVRLMWRPQDPFSLLFPVELPGVVCTFTVESREGTWRFVRRFGSPRRAQVPVDELYAPGIDGTALQGTAFFSSAGPTAMRLAEGTIEFWVKPRWDGAARPAGPRGSLAHTFFNRGPIRPDYPYLSNRDSLTISESVAGYLSCILSNSNYESRSVQASIRDWRKDQWHHVALQWKLDDGGKTAMALFIDGKLASDRCTAGGQSLGAEPLQVKAIPLPVQVGSMNTGFRPADADIDELRISSTRRYEGTFAPAKRFEVDGDTLALFHFDGNLQAAAPEGLVATAGPAQ